MSDSLDDYKRKRDFDTSPEPAGRPARVHGGRKAPARALQFCIQKHDATRLHYDFRLELDGTFKSWAVPKGPSLDPQVKRLAIQVEDHPLDYADFEGHIPEGHYGAGDVIVWDRGIWIPQLDPVAGYAMGKLKFELRGEKLSGIWNLVRTNMPGKQEQWFLIKHRDDAARTEGELDITEALPGSVLSERTLLPKAKGKQTPEQQRTPVSRRSRGKRLEGSLPAPLPAFIKPQLATLVDDTPDGDWRYEVKFDGYRILARIEHGEVWLFTRNGKDWSTRLPGQRNALAGLGLESAWLDGEVIVAGDDGTPDFQALQNAFETGRSEDILYYLFDLLYLDGNDLRGVPLEQRRATLEKLLKDTDDSLLRYSADLIGDPDSLLGSACRMKLEGLIGKRAGSLYQSRRSTDWIKLKCKQRQEFVIVGYTEPKGSRSHFGALLLALHDEDSGELRYAGKVGTGFDQATLTRVQARMKPLDVAKPTLANPPTGTEATGVHWLKPELLAEVAFAEMTREGLVRHAVFNGLRSDKPASAITFETPRHAAGAKQGADARPAHEYAGATARKVRITHPDRIIDASLGSTKRDLVEYYADIAPWLLPQLRDRPLALLRAPDGIAGELFFQKSGEQLGIDAMELLEKSRAGQPAMVINSIEALIGAVQMGTLELHTWNATGADLDHPDRFILDLDPDPALPWKTMVEATQLVLTVLDELGLTAFLKTSGGKGMHLVVPLKPKDDWDQVKDFSHAIATHMAQHLPQRFSAKSGPKNRVGKIFIDYLRNGLGATTVTAYSVRAREGLPVSVPVLFEEIAALKGAHDWTIRNLRKRLDEAGESPWAGFENQRQTITRSMRKRLGLA